MAGRAMVADDERAILDLLYAWHERHWDWYECCDPATMSPKQFDVAHYEMAAAWLRVVKALDARRRETR